MKQELPIDTRNMLTKMLDELKENRGKGFVAFYEGEEELPYIGTALPKKVYIITDERCGSSGDAFVYNMRRSDKVTVVGCPTTGVLDFSNCTWVDYGHFKLVYPTSRNLYLDKGVRMRGRGVAVDIPIPWTPEHLNRDIDLERVLKLIEQNEQ